MKVCTASAVTEFATVTPGGPDGAFTTLRVVTAGLGGTGVPVIATYSLTEGGETT
jgi:hypothetical protein